MGEGPIPKAAPGIPAGVKALVFHRRSLLAYAAAMAICVGVVLASLVLFLGVLNILQYLGCAFSMQPGIRAARTITVVAPMLLDEVQNL